MKYPILKLKSVLLEKLRALVFVLKETQKSFKTC